MAARQVVACIVSPNVSDADLAVTLLRENGIEACSFGNMYDMAGALGEATGCLVLVEEALLAEAVPALREALDRMPAWSDLPLIIVSRDVARLSTLTANAFPKSGNVTLLERPLNPLAFLSAVQVALRATMHQREVAELIAQREHAVKLRDEFLAMLAHELRNPLAPMRNSLHIMRMSDVQEPLVLRTVAILERQVTHLVRMVDDLMDVARLERGKVALKKQRVDLNRIVAAAVETCLQTTQDKGHRVSVRFDTSPLPVEADPVRIEQIVCNLLNNAAKFSSVPDEIRVHTSMETGFAVVVVQDRGIGFNPEVANRLFDPFLQANPTLERSAGGLGMGLTIVKRLAELHGGAVSANSDGPGNGSRFTVRIPLSPATEHARTEPLPSRPEASPRRIVVIEDNPDIRETLNMLLTLWGHQVVLASDGPTGLQRVLEDRPDVALIDVGLPLMNGYDVARAIRQRIPNGGIRLIAMTGYGQPSDRELAIASGFNMHLLKPIPPELLESVLAEQD